MEVNMLCEELDEAKAEIEKLRCELKWKCEECEGLRKARHDQAARLKECNKELEKQAEGIWEKSEENDGLKKEVDKLRCNLKEKESAIKHLHGVNERLKADSLDRIRQWEEEKRELLMTIDEATSKNEDREIAIRSLKEEVEGTQKLLSISKAKHVELQRIAGAPNGNADALLLMEDQKIKLEDQLKWKKEQFVHLQEAHEKMRSELARRKNGWERESSMLIDKVCSLEERLIAESRIAEESRKRLVMSNQALEQAESRRSCVESELSALKSRFQDALIELEATKSQLEDFTAQRGDDIASLTSSLRDKEKMCRELQYRTSQLELDNQELLESLREFREARMREASSSQRRKTKNAQKKKLGFQEDAGAKNLESDLEASYSEIEQLKLQNEEAALTLIVLKSGIDAILKNADNFIAERVNDLHDALIATKSDLELEREKSKSKETQILDEFFHERVELEKAYRFQVEELNEKLGRTKCQLEEYLEKAKSLSERVESLEVMEHQHALAKNELETCRGKLEDSVRKQEFLGENLRKACDALDIANSELDLSRKNAASVNDLHQGIKLKLEEEVKNCGERLKELSKNLIHMQQQAALKEILHKESMKKLQGELNEMNDELVAEIRESHSAKFELWIWKSIAEKMKAELEDNQLLRRNLESSLISQIEVGESIKRERGNLEEEIEKLEVVGLRRELEISILEGTLRERELQEEDHTQVCEVLHSYILTVQLEDEWKKQMIAAFEEIIHSSSEEAVKLEAEIEEKHLKIRGLEKEIEDAKAENERSAMERESVLDVLTKLSNKMVEFSAEDTQLLRLLGTISEDDDEVEDDQKENGLCASAEKANVSLEERVPFRELN